MTIRIERSSFSDDEWIARQRDALGRLNALPPDELDRYLASRARSVAPLEALLKSSDEASQITHSSLRAALQRYRAQSR